MKKLVAGAMAAMLLGGCQSIFGHHAARLDVHPVGEVQTTAEAAIALEEGRQYLAGGEVASAIVAFRTASLDPATAASAHNGLAVAYALLGRGDLAERFFQRAIEEDPFDPRFAANLDRFYRSRDAKMAKVENFPAVASTEVAMSATMIAEAPLERVFRAGPSLVRVSSPTQREALTRVSLREVVIHTLPQDAVPATADPRRRNPRFVATKPARSGQTYPLRIDLAKLAKR